MADPTLSELALGIAETVRGVPGVVRLEPTLGTGGPQGLYRRGPTDGIRVVSVREAVHVEVNVAIAASHQARAVAERLERDIADLLLDLHCTPGRLTVNVLSIDDL